MRVATWYSATTSAVVSTARTWTSAQRIPSNATDDAQVAAPKRMRVPVWYTGFTLAWPRMSDRSHSQAMIEAITLATCSMTSEPVRPAPSPSAAAVRTTRIMGSAIEPTMAFGRIVRKPMVAESTTMVNAADGSPTATQRRPSTISGSP